jgi:DNA-binding CsgD family transcriptional regulator
MKLELTRSLIDYGLMLGQSEETSQARQILREAVRLARDTECSELIERSKSALTAAGGRIRNAPICGVASLTRSERRVVLLAATGKTNREIAKQLFVGLRTVEIHLTNSYRKLDIDSRGQLAQAIQSTSDAETADDDVAHVQREYVALTRPRDRLWIGRIKPEHTRPAYLTGRPAAAWLDQATADPHTCAPEHHASRIN